LTTSVTLGLAIVFALKGSSAVSTTDGSISPAADLALGAIIRLAAVVLRTVRDKRSAGTPGGAHRPKDDKATCALAAGTEQGPGLTPTRRAWPANKPACTR
jgi:hypothetical protein